MCAVKRMLKNQVSGITSQPSDRDLHQKICICAKTVPILTFPAIMGGKM